MTSKLYYAKADGTFETITIPSFNTDVYPSRFFSTPHKPRVNIPIFSDADNKVPQAVYYGLIHCDLKSNVVCRYLWDTLFKESALNPSKWESYGVTLGEEGENVTVFCTLEKVETNSSDTLTVDETFVGDGSAWMPFVIVCLYKLAEEHAFVKTIMAEIRRHPMNAAIPSALNLQTIAQSCTHWRSDSNLTKIMAAIDMFYYRFPKEKHSVLRFGTIISRYKHCGAVPPLQRLLSITGITSFSTLEEWVSDLYGVPYNMNIILEKTEECEKEFSYFPYQIDMQIVSKSAYTVSKLLFVHFWANAVCALLNDHKSMNAKMLILKEHARPFHDFAKPAIIMAYVYSNSRRVELDEPQSKNPRDWYLYYKDNRFDLTSGMKNFAKNAMRSFDRAKPGTIAAWFPSALEAYLNEHGN